MRAPTPTVLKMGQLNFSGNIIPHTWYQHLCKTVMRKSGKTTTAEVETPYLEAIIILSDICYWYRPQQVRDEETGQVIELRRRFQSDKLQRSYQQLADSFGIGKDAARAAVRWLEKRGLITVELRDIAMRGIPLQNVMYLEPIVKAIAALNMPIGGVSDVHKTPPPIDIKDPPLCTSDTYTCISAGISPQTSEKEPPLADSPPVEELVILSDIQMPPAPPIRAITVEHAADSPPDALRQQLDDLLENDPDALVEALGAVGESLHGPLSRMPPRDDSAETAATFKPPPPREPRTAEDHKASIRLALEEHANNGDRAGVADPTKDGDPWVDIAVKEWARISGKDFEQMSIGTKLLLAGVFRKVGAVADSGAVPVAAAIGRFPGEHKWWAEKVGFEWPSDNFCNKLGMMLVPDVAPEPQREFTFVDPDWLGATT